MKNGIGGTNMPNIYFLWATIRPEMMYETYKQWISNCILDSNIILKCAVYTQEQKETIDNYNINNCDVIVVSDKRGYPYAVSKLAHNLEVNDEDIVILTSDDFYSPVGWDKYLIDKFTGFEGALFLDDGYQDINIKDGMMLALTTACMTFKCLKQLNKVLMHPDYFHFFSDNEIFQNLKCLGLLKDDRDIDNMVFEHKNCHMGKRLEDEYDAYYLSHRQEDEVTFLRRMNMPIEERLIINE